MTNPIGAGTVNLSLNLTLGERQILGRLAFRQDQSIGDLTRRLIHVALRESSPELAVQWEHARETRRAISGAALLIAGMVMLAVQIAGADLDARRARVNRRQTVRREVEA